MTTLVESEDKAARSVTLMTLFHIEKVEGTGHGGVCSYLVLGYRGRGIRSSRSFLVV